jgi:micrococcal nuclease
VKVPRGVVVLVVIAALAGAAWLVARSADEPASGGAAPASGDSAPGPSVPVPAGARSEVVEYVHDGDTLFLEDGTKVRLLGVDTPEIGEHAECYGEEARALLRELLPEGTRVRVVADVQPLDQYGRALLFLFTDDDRLVNLDLIEAGAAEAVVLKPNVLYAEELEAAEDRAQLAGSGMWGVC